VLCASPNVVILINGEMSQKKKKKKKNEMMSFAGKWMGLEITVVRKISQSLSPIYGI
jgi:hypothetical protein